MDGLEFLHELVVMVFRAAAIAFVVMLIACIVVGHFAGIGWDDEDSKEVPIALGETTFRP